MDKMGVKLDNMKNVLIQGTKSILMGHPWMLLDDDDIYLRPAGPVNPAAL
jgi:hypothetical protein